MRGSIVELEKDRRYRVYVSLGADPLTGKRRRRAEIVRGTRDEAERALTKMLHELDTGLDLDPGRITTGEYLTRWLEHASHQVRPSTHRRYRSLVANHIAPAVGSVKLSKLKAGHVQAVVDRMRADGAATASVLQAYRVLSAALRRAVKWGLLAVNPAAAVEPPEAGDPDLRIPAPADLVRLLEAAAGHGYGDALTLAIATGLRRGEVLGARWQDVALESGLLRVRRGLEEQTLELVPLKTRRARREVALPGFAVEMLRRVRREQTERRLAWGEAWHDLGLVFDRGDGRPMFPSKFSAAFRRIADGIGLEGVRLHDCRHGWATACLVAGVHPKIVSEGLGHASTSFTLDTYSHVVPGLQELAARAIEDALGPGAGTHVAHVGGDPNAE